MFNLREAHFRHASHFEGTLRAANEIYERGGAGIAETIARFEADWENVRRGQEWAASRADGDEQAAALCSDYPNAGMFLLRLRRHPREIIRWLEKAVEADRQAGDRVYFANDGASYWPHLLRASASGLIPAQRTCAALSFAL